MILGIDEVGRGAWAGPVVVGAVAIESGVIEGLNDSKLLSKKKRAVFSGLIRQHAAWIGIGWVSARKIDEIGMSAALKLAAERSVVGVPGFIQEIIIDGTIRLIEAPNVTTLKKADQLIPAVSAASIIAKVARDQYMYVLDEQFPQYGFGSHVGYGTAAHQAALETHGPSPLHRMSFSPMSDAKPVKATRTIIETSGYKAESAVVEYLQANGFKVVERNWKTKRCEIDIVAMKNNEVFFVEVKYRKNANQGRGFDYITSVKQAQMSFAAEAWRTLKGWNGPVRLAAAEVEGENFIVSGFIAEIHASEVRRARTRQFG